GIPQLVVELLARSLRVIGRLRQLIARGFIDDQIVGVVVQPQHVVQDGLRYLDLRIRSDTTGERDVAVPYADVYTRLFQTRILAEVLDDDPTDFVIRHVVEVEHVAAVLRSHLHQPPSEVKRRP